MPIDPGTIVLVDLFEVHTDKELWGEDADQFVPERWLVGNAATSDYYPFGGGPRVCIGANLAYIELKLALTQILRHFRIKETLNTGVSLKALNC